MNSNLFIVESPFQLLGAIEAQNYFQGMDSVLILKLTPEKRNNKQMKELLRFANWGKVFVAHSFFFVTTAELFIIPIILYYRMTNRTFSRIFVGEPRSKFMNIVIANVQNDESYFLDDGNLTFWINDMLNKQFSVKNILAKSGDAKLKGLLYRFFGLRTDFNFVPHWFTCFDIESKTEQKIVQHNFEYIKSKLDLNSKTEDVYFIGGNFSELGIINHDDELNLLSTIFNTYYSNKPISYCAHRRESKQKLSKIEAISERIKIRSFNYPLELALILQGIKIDNFSSFQSTALLTLNKIFSPENIVMFRIPDELVSGQFKAEISSTYFSYAKYINKIDL